MVNNIVKLVSKGKAIGVTTGKFIYDEPNDTTFLEFYTLGAKTAGKHFFFVAKSQVELITTDEKTKREKTGGKIPLEILAGTTVISKDHQQQILSRHSTPVYDEQFKFLLIASVNTILGFPLMTLNAGRSSYVKFETIQGKIRWVNKDDVIIKNRVKLK